MVLDTWWFVIEKQESKMSDVFEGYERQYCELSASLSRKCTAAGAVDGGIG